MKKFVTYPPRRIENSPGNAPGREFAVRVYQNCVDAERTAGGNYRRASLQGACRGGHAAPGIMTLHA
jgi:hypothetical protein